MVSSSSLSFNPFVGNNINKNNDIKKNKRGKGSSYVRPMGEITFSKTVNEVIRHENPEAFEKAVEECNFHKELKELCIENDKFDPKPEKSEKCKGWSRVKKFDKANPENEYSGRVYKKRGTFVIIYKVLSNPIEMLEVSNNVIRGIAPKQYEDAALLYKNLRNANPEAKIVLTGYGLGGSLAQLLAYQNEDAAAVTFNSLGMAKYFTDINNPQNVKNIVNYLTSKEPRYIRENHIGQTRIIFFNEYNMNESADFGFLLNTNPITNKHVLNDFDNLHIHRVNFVSAA